MNHFESLAESRMNGEPLPVDAFMALHGSYALPESREMDHLMNPNPEKDYE